ncbi:hypothetical protein A8B82_06915 [Sulfitobacter sp. EhC04]|uniref:IclR family transcriptional regulator n=1 Tax=Sulfitobacter sp. EhC04 TaxID=1849168 RepID=UPI0007F4CAA8|nr:helix-turn-helix domain-containing protein [Sulfitobacter sp. EhC04]MAY86065.1 transcriptional regulator [Pseudooceanicola sp.]OAN80139.1 hypothetical protein A8B82_06915 [Sulfitobacter sp. EhC04]
MSEEKKSTSTLQTLDRGLKALALIAQSTEGIKIAKLADLLGVHRPIAYRIVATLEENGLVRRLAEGQIALAAGAYLLGARSADHVRGLATPLLEKLANATGATAFLSMAQGEECVVALTAEPQNSNMNIHYRIGSRHPLSKGAAGIAILAGREATDEDTDAVIACRQTGVSVTRGELHRGAVGVSSPVDLPSTGFSGFEFSIGVVALEELDIDTASRHVLTAAIDLAWAFK